MCEQTGVTYLGGDIVWVKLGNCWWPGEVQDQEKLSEEIRSDFKKPPIAVVKFFQEDSYEYVRNINHIYKYSCRRKNEFVRKGLDMHRANKAYMDTFPADVCHAETLTGGDPDIITRDDFIPEKRPSYSNIFRTPTPKKPKTGTGRGRQSLGATPRSASSGSSKSSRITHPRFTGNNDYGVTIMIQTTPPPKTSQYSCHVCSYETTNLYVMMRHNQSHIDGTYVAPSPKKKKTSPKKMKSAKYFATTNSIDEDLALIRQGVIITTDGSSDSEEDLPPKAKVKSPPKSTIKRKNNKESNSASKKAKMSKVFNNILADWGDENSNEETESTENTDLNDKKDNTVNVESAASEKVNEETISETPEEKFDTEDKNQTGDKDQTGDKLQAPDTPEIEKTPQTIVVEEEKKIEEKIPEKVSCFDFDEEETDDTILEKSPGRKIPRVIPPKRISKDTFEEELDKLADESVKSRTADEQTNYTQLNENEETEPDMEAYKTILEETAMPELPPILEVLGKNIITSKKFIEPKTDDSTVDKSNGVLKKSETKAPEVSITQAPKKRMVRNFEEFENLMHDQPEGSVKSPPQPKSNLEVSKLKFQVMKKLNDSPTKKQSTSKREESENEETTPEETNKFFRRRTRHSRSDSEKSESNRRKRKTYIASPKKPESEDVDKIETELENVALEEKKSVAEETIPAEIQTFLEEPMKDIKASVVEEDKTEIAENLVEEKTDPSLVENVESKNDVAELGSTIESDVPPTTEEEDMQIITQSQDSKNLSDQDVEENFPEDAFLEENFPIAKIEEPPEKELPSENISEASRSHKLLADISDICIDNSDNLSGLSTLAAVSELSENLKSITEDAEIQSLEETIVPSNPPTVIEEIARGGTPVLDEPVEEIVPVKPKTLANFSLDFSDSNSESTTIIKKFDNDEHIDTTLSKEDLEPFEKTEKKDHRVIEEFEAIESEIEKITLRETAADKLNSFPEDISNNSQDDMEIETSYPEFSIPEPSAEKNNVNFQAKNSEIVLNTEMSLESEIAKLTDTQPGTESILPEQQQNTSSSKLLEILTDAPTKKETVARSILSPSSASQQKIQMAVKESKPSQLPKKFDPKSKFIIKSSTYKPAKSAKPIILSEKIIRPMAESENVSVKKVTSKRSLQDVEDIDTFIIQKPNKKPASESIDQHEIILAPKIEPMKNLKSIGVRSRAKPKIIEQTIIKAADVQPVSLQPSDNQQNILDDSMFDINSMPIVLSDQILTPESIENMPVVMSNMIPSVSTSSPIIHTEKNTSTILSKKTGTMKLINKDKTITSQSTSSQSDSPKTQTIVKNIIPRTLGKNQKIFQATSKMLKQNTAVITQPGKPGKFLVIPTSNSSPSSGSKYTVGKRPVKNLQQISPTTSKLKPIQQNLTSEPTGNKIMIITNERGVQSRVLLTPAQQKLLGCKMPTKITKSPQVKSIAQKSILTSKGTIISPMTSKTTALASQTIVTSKGQMYTTQQGGLVTSEGQILTQIKGKPDIKGKKIQLQTSKVMLPDHNKAGDSLQKVTKANILQKTKTILIKGSQGQAIKKIQTSMPESKNVLISPSSQKQHLMSMASQHVQSTGKQVVVTSKGQLIKADSKFITKATADKLRMQKSSPIPTRIVSKSNKSQYTYSPAPKQLPSPVVPPLTPITESQKKEISKQIKHSPKVATSVVETPTTSSTKQPNQLVIQDPQGNQTTVTEGQILALPSGETVDGQPQSYVLVTVDESGNLVPISNDTLMSLDPNLAMGGDMSNIVIQIDPGNQEGKTTETAVVHSSNEVQPLEQVHTTLETMNQAQTQEQQLMSVDDQLMITGQTILPASTASEIIATEKSLVETHPEQFVTEETHMVTADDVNLLHETQQTAVTCNINNGDSSQQLIITGDPESTQKFLDSLTGGNTDLSSLLSGTDGNIIINADGQQILLNTDSDNQILLSVNPDNLGLIPGTSEGESTQFVTQSVKNQDILAAALADTDVFQQEMVDKTISSQSLTKVSSSSASQLSPNSSLYPINVGNVLETSLTLGSPIMTPLEVPSMNNKKILDVENTIQVPSSLELPITITDPNISQTVSQQVLLGNDLQTNLELPITMSESEITSIRSSGMNSPSFVYSLPSLDERSDLEQKRFTETSTVMSADVYNTSLTGSMSMPLLTEEPEINSVEPATTSLDTQISLETDIELIKPEVSVEAELNSVAPDDSSVVPEIISEPPETSSLSEIVAQECDSVGRTKLVSESEIVSMETEITTLEPQHPTIEPAISITAPEISTIEPEISTMEPEITTIEPHSSSIESAISTIEPEISTIESEISTIEPKISTIEPEISSIDSEISTIQPEIPTMESEISTIEPEISTIEPEITTIEPEVSTIRPEFSTIESEITSVDSEMHTAESEIPLAHHEVTTVESEYVSVETKIPSAELPTVDSEIESVEPDITSIEPEIPIVGTEIPSLETEIPIVQSEVAMEDPERTTITSREDNSVVDKEEIKDNVAIPCSESEQIQNLNFASDSLTTPEKLDAELQIGPIEDDLDLNHSVICSSLSEPPPGMFDKSFSSLLNRDDDDEDDDDSPAEESNLPILPDNVEDAHAILSVPEESTSVESAVNEVPTEDQRHSDLLSPPENINFEVDDMMQTDDVHPALSATPISDLNSPRLDIDENSSEIPIQPQIVASLSGSGFDDNISGDEGSNSHEGRRKRSNEEFEESDVKRTKVSCD